MHYLKNVKNSMKATARLAIILLFAFVLAVISPMTAYATSGIWDVVPTEYWAVKVGEKHVAFLAAEEELDQAIEMVKEFYAGEEEIDSVEILQDITLESYITFNPEDANEQAVEAEELFEKLMTYDIKEVKYVVKAGDSIQGIAKSMAIPEEDVIKMNPGLNDEELVEGKKLTINKPEYLLDVVVEKTVVATEAIPFDTVYEEDADMYVDEEEVVKTEGQEGILETVSKVVEVNGVVQEQSEVSKTVVTEPTNKVILKGTKERPPATVWPYIGRVTSYFGYRYDVYYVGTSDHAGIDISASYGSPVVAFRAGVVTGETGWDGGYGYCVHIDHGNGLESLYGHNSSILVSPGQQVEPGDIVALAGSTGWSTGTHVHFELRLNGVPVDPMAYLP